MLCIHSAFGPDPIPYPKREFINEEDDTKSNKVCLDCDGVGCHLVGCSCSRLTLQVILMFSRAANKRQVEMVTTHLTKGCVLQVETMFKKVIHHLHISHQITIINNHIIITNQTDLAIIRLVDILPLQTCFYLNHNGGFKCT